MRYATNGRGVCLWAGRRSSLRAAGMGNLEFDDLLLDVSRVGHDGSAGDLSHVVGEIGDGVAHAGVPGAVAAALAVARTAGGGSLMVCKYLGAKMTSRVLFA